MLRPTSTSSCRRRPRILLLWSSSPRTRAWSWTFPTRTSWKAVRRMLAAAPGERLRTLRDILGLPQDQLAELSGVGQSWISQVETSSRDATEDMLRQIAAATGTPFGFFYVRPSSVPLDSLRFRKTSAARRKTTRRVHAVYGESYRVTEDLVDAEKYPTPSLPYATGDDPLTEDQIEQLAADTREALRLAPNAPIPHLTRALERAGVAVAPMVLPEIDGDENAPVGHFGVSFWGVSIQALIMRGHTVGSIGDTRKNSLFVQLSAKGWRKREPVTVHHEEPKLLWTLLERRYGAKPYLRAADGLAIHPTFLWMIRPPPRERGEDRVAADGEEKVIPFRRR